MFRYGREAIGSQTSNKRVLQNLGQVQNIRRTNLLMRFIATISVGFALLALGTERVVGASMSDPIFGMRYNTQDVHFDYAPVKVSRFCGGFRGRRFWLYAYWKAGNREYFIVSDQVSEISGSGVVLYEAQCITGLPDWLIYGTMPPDGAAKLTKITEDVRHGLVKDLLRRYSAAFGGKKNFLRSESRDGLPPYDLPLIFRVDFEEFATSP